MRAVSALLIGLIGLASTRLALAAPADDWNVRRDPFDRATVARYKAILASDPHDSVFAALYDLYRRHRSIEQLRREFDGGEWAALVVAGRIEHARGSVDAAIAIWKRAVAIRSSDAHAWILIGDASRKSAPGEARVAYQHALASSPPRAVAIRVLQTSVELALAAGDHAAADTLLGELVRLDPQEPAHRIARGDVRLSASRPVDAVVSYREAEVLLGSDPARRREIAARRAEALARAGRELDAIETLRDVIALIPRGSTLAFDHGRRIRELARRTSTVAALRARFELEWPEARRGYFEWIMLAEMHADSGGLGRALAAFEAAARTSPSEPYPRQRIAQLLDAAGRSDEATAQLERFARGAKEPAIHVELAGRYWPRAPDKAIAILEALAARLPNDVSVAVSIADLYTRWERHDLAVVAYRRVVRLDPAYIVVLAIALAATGDRQGVVELTRQVVRDPKKLGDLAKVMLDFAMWNDAIETFTAALAIDPKRAELWSGRAGAREGLEKWDEGAADAERGVLALTSNDPRVRQTARHLFVRLAARSSRRAAYYEAWRLLEAREPSHVDAEPIATELKTVAAFEAAMIVPGLERIAAAVPRDPIVRVELAARYVELERHDAALAMLREAARLLPDNPVLARRIDDVRKLRATFLTDLAWSRAAWRAPTALVDSVPQRDAADQPTRLGVRVGASIGAAPGITFGVIATRTWGTRSLVTRLDFTEQADLHIGGAGVGMTSRFATPRSLVAIGGGVRVEYRAGGAAVPVGLAGELGLDLTSRFNPVGLGLRIARFLDGETRAGLELVVELR